MKSHCHTLTGTAAWTVGCVALDSLGHHVPAAVVTSGAVVAGGWALWPDLDVQGTAARSLGPVTRAPAYGIEWLTTHRGATHWASTTIALAASLAILGWVDLLGVSLSAAAVFLGLVWCEAGFAADDPYSRRRHAPARALLATFGTVLALDLTGGWWWVPAAVAVGGLSHLAGDCLTRSKYPMLAPLTFREVGGLGVIPPTPRGQRVTWQERLLEALLWAATVAAMAVTTSAALAGMLVVGTALGWAARVPGLGPRRRRRGMPLI